MTQHNVNVSLVTPEIWSQSRFGVSPDRYDIPYHATPMSGSVWGDSPASGAAPAGLARATVVEDRPVACTLYGVGRRKHIAQPKWTADERMAFGDGVRTRASTVPDKRKRESKRACRQPVTDDTEK